MTGSSLKCDVAIIGAGTAGLSAERSARRAGARTLLIDEAFRGTTCAAVGCMPSKLLIAAGNAAAGVRQAAQFGISATPSVDGKAVMDRVRRERDRFVDATRAGIEKLPDGIRLQGVAHFVDGTTLDLQDRRRVEAHAIVIATGSRPAMPPSLQGLGERILTNETVFELTRLPRDLAVVGAGPLGLELAQAFSRLGVKVTVFAEDRALGGIKEGPILARMIEAFGKDFELRLGVHIKALSTPQHITLSWEGDSAGDQSFDYVLAATGRPPDLTRLKIEASGLSLDKHGVPVFDGGTTQCGQHPIFMAGDVTADRPVLHEADRAGAVAGYNAASFPKVTSVNRTTALSIMFTEPALAVVGEQGDVCGFADYRNQGRARVEGRAEGLVEIYARAGDGCLTGATLFCPAADHLAHLLDWAIESRLDASTLMDRPFYHPTFEEGLKPALRQICEKLDIAPPSVRDVGAVPGT